MTFIIAIQAEDSIVVASDTREFKLDNQYQLQPSYDKVIKKTEIWNLGVFASNGIDLIGSQVFEKLCQDGDANKVQDWLIDTAKQVTIKLNDNHSILLKQIACTQIYCSSPTQQRPQLRSISQTYDEAFEINSLRIMAYQKDLSSIMPLLQTLQQNITARNKFVDDIGWMRYYVDYFQNIFYEMNQADDWVSQGFHVYFEHCTDRFFGYVPNQQGCQVIFDI